MLFRVQVARHFDLYRTWTRYDTAAVLLIDEGSEAKRFFMIYETVKKPCTDASDLTTEDFEAHIDRRLAHGWSKYVNDKRLKPGDA